MAEGPHRQKLCAGCYGTVLQRLGDASTIEGKIDWFGVVSAQFKSGRKRLGQVRAAECLLILHGQDRNAASCGQKRQRIVKGAGGDPAFIPRDCDMINGCRFGPWRH